MTTQLLVIDHDVEFTEQLTTHLSPEGFQLIVAHDGESGLKKALHQPPDAIIFDIHLPSHNGFEVLKTIHAHQNVPILLLTARCDDLDRILCLEHGADAFLQKPCNPRELLATLRALLRRQQIPVKHHTFTHQHITLNTADRSVSQQGKNIELTNTEFLLLEILMRSPTQAFSKEELTEFALNKKYSIYDRSVDMHVSHLRVKLGETFIQTVRGFGYKLNHD